MSPSVASVTSGSTNASGVDGNQRRLDWDPLADFGYEAHISRVCYSDTNINSP